MRSASRRRPEASSRCPMQPRRTAGAPNRPSNCERFAEETAMITGAHILFYSTNPEADRAFFRDVLEFRAIDIGRGWMIFALPPAEAAVHPGDGEFSETHAGHQMMGALVYLMCDDLRATIRALAAKNVK